MAPHALKTISRYSAYMLAASTSVLGSAALAQTAPSASDTSVQEIVVTATRESAQISKVPLSISAFSQRDLDAQGVRTFQDVLALTPGINLIAKATFQPPNIAIRGIQSGVGSQTTGIYIDDVPIQGRISGNQDPGSALPKIFDLTRVEVLRGPQGTLFGAGSEGGAVRFITPTPSLTTMSTYARAELSDTSHGGVNYEGGVAVGGPIIHDKLGFRVSVWDRQDSGWLSRINPNTGVTQNKNSNSQSSQAVKLSALYQPTPQISITPSLYYQYTGSKDTTQYYPALSNPSSGSFISGRLIPQPTKDDFYLPSLTIAGNFAGLTLTSVTAAFERRENAVADFGGLDWNLSKLFTGQKLVAYPPDSYSGSPFYDNNQNHNISEELRIQPEDSGGRLNWVAGLFVSQNRQSTFSSEPDQSLAGFFQAFFRQPNVNGNIVYIDAISTLDKQLAGFANVDYKLTQTLKLTAGVRVTQTNFSFTNSGGGSVNGGPHNFTGSQKETPVTPKVSLSWQKDPENLFYFTFAQGYREGGANTPVPVTPPCTANLAQIGLTAAPQSYNSDSTQSFELGAKNRLLGGSLQLASSAYHINWQNIQQNVSLPNCAGSFTSNLGSATSNGFDVQFTARPTSSLTLSGSVGYTKVTYDKTLTSGGLHIVDAGSVVSDAPPWQVAVTGRYDFDMMGRRSYLQATDEYASHNPGPFTNLNDPLASGYDPTQIQNPAYNQLNLRLGVLWHGADVALFSSNTLDAHPQLFYQHTLGPSPAYFATTLTPRVVGVTASYRY